MTRAPRWLRALLRAAIALSALSVVAQPVRAQEKAVRATLRQLQDAWLSVDAALLGTYAGIDSSLGSLYHAIDVTEVWMGSPAPGRLLCKAPRGVDAEVGDQALFMLWDRLNGATDSYLENATRLYGDDAWRRVGPDSVASYLLPFSRYAFRLDDGRIVLRGTSVYRQELKRSQLHGKLLDYELTLLPEALYRDSDLVVRGRVSRVDKRKREIEGIAVEYRVSVELDLLGVIKGDPPDALRLDYSSFPRSPRFDQDEEVILFLSRYGDELVLKYGKRAVYHVIDGSVAETDQPLPEFLKGLRGKAD